jgi:hypothetical protein
MALCFERGASNGIRRLTLREEIMNRIILLAMGMLAFACIPTTSQATISSLIVTGATVSTSTGITTVSGTIVCTAGDLLVINETLFQAAGPHVGVAAGFTVDSPCSGGTDAWKITNSALVGGFKPGAAGDFLQAFDQDGSMIGPLVPQVLIRPAVP